MLTLINTTRSCNSQHKRTTSKEVVDEIINKWRKRISTLVLTIKSLIKNNNKLLRGWV